MRYGISILSPDESGSIEIGHFDLDPFPGCHFVGISHALEIKPEYRNKGYGTQAHKDRLDIARSLGYQILLCTIRSTNKAQVKILRKYGWKIVKEFSNIRANRSVTLYYKDLHDPYGELYAKEGWNA